MEPVTFTTEIDTKSYIKLALKKVLLSNFTLMVYTSGIMILFLAWIIVDMDQVALNMLTIVIILILTIYPINVYFRVKKASKGKGAKVIWMIDDSGIEMIGENAQGKYSWNFFSKVTEDKEWLFLWYHTGRYTYFPKKSVSPDYLREIKKAIYLHRAK